MWYIKTFALISLASIIQFSFLNSFKFLIIVPNIFLVLGVYFLLKKDINKSLAAVLFMGLLMDIISIRFFGFYILFFLTLVIIISVFKKHIGRSQGLSQATIAVIVSGFILIFLEIITVLSLNSINSEVIAMATKSFLFSSASNIILLLFLNPLLSRLYKVENSGKMNKL